MKYPIILISCGIAGLLTGQLLRVPSDGQSHKSQVPVLAPIVESSPTPAPSTDISALVESLAKGPADPNVEFQFMLFDSMERLTPAELATFTATVLQHPSPLLKNNRYEIVGYWASRDLPAARAYVLRLSDDRASSYAFGEPVAQTWFRKDPAGFGEWLASQPPSDLKNQGKAHELLRHFVRIGGADFPDRVLALIASLPDSYDRESADELLFTAWANRDPGAAAARVLQLNESAAKAKAIESIAAAWAEKNPTAAWAWISALPDAVVVQKAQRAFINGLAKTNPAAAAERLADLPLTEESGLLVERLADQWAHIDPETALKWARKVDDSIRDKALKGIREGAMGGDLDLAVRFITDHSDEIEPSESSFEYLMFRASQRYRGDLTSYILRFPEKYRAAAVIGAEKLMNVTQPDFVETWALREPEGDIRSQLLVHVAESRCKLDLEASVPWVKALPEGPSKSQVVDKIVDQFYSENPERSMEVLRTLTPPDALGEALADHVERWMIDSPKAAQRWIQKTTALTPQQRKELLRIGRQIDEAPHAPR